MSIAKNSSKALNEKEKKSGRNKLKYFRKL